MSDPKQVDPTDRTAFNAAVIEQFRTNAGKVEIFGDVPILLLHHQGAKSHTARLNPLMYQRVGDSFAVFASKGGEPEHPAWFHNVCAHPSVAVEVATDGQVDTYPVVARIAEGDERERIWEQQKLDNPSFANMEKRTTRVIPVVVLDRVE